MLGGGEGLVSGRPVGWSWGNRGLELGRRSTDWWCWPLGVWNLRIRRFSDENHLERIHNIAPTFYGQLTRWAYWRHASRRPAAGTGALQGWVCFGVIKTALFSRQKHQNDIVLMLWKTKKKKVWTVEFGENWPVRPVLQSDCRFTQFESGPIHRTRLKLWPADGWTNRTIWSSPVFKTMNFDRYIYIFWIRELKRGALVKWNCPRILFTIYIIKITYKIKSFMYILIESLKLK